jgi:hypothetical protein
MAKGIFDEIIATRRRRISFGGNPQAFVAEEKPPLPTGLVQVESRGTIPGFPRRDINISSPLIAAQVLTS